MTSIEVPEEAPATPLGPGGDDRVVVADPNPSLSGGRSRPSPSTLPSAVVPVIRWALALAGSIVVFGLFIALRGEAPVDAVKAIWESAGGDMDALGETFVRATPLLLGALAVVVPARAGLFNIGGEGQLIMGAIGAQGASMALGGAAPAAVTLVVMALGGAGLGAAWAGISIALRQVFRTNEAITTLLLNYLASLILTWLVFEPWKDPQSLGQAYSETLDDRSRFGILWGDRVHLGVLVAVGAAVVVWFVLTRTRWGFRLRVMGGNPEAARRAGFGVGALALGAMICGGALAGLGGMVEIAGVEGRLRPELLAGFGYTAFLASWLAKHDPLKVVATSVLLGGIVVGGFGLKIATGLSGGAVQVLTALVLLAVLGFAQAPTPTRS